MTLVTTDLKELITEVRKRPLTRNVTGSKIIHFIPNKDVLEFLLECLHVYIQALSYNCYLSKLNLTIFIQGPSL